MSRPIVAITIDTEEDNWGEYSWDGATVQNIQLLPRLQEVFDRHGARPTYLVGYAPLTAAGSVGVLGELAERSDVEIGSHCHPWNTPPRTDPGMEHSMMFRFSEEVNLRKIDAVRDRTTAELGVTPTSFRAGRWGMGPTVTKALHRSGFHLDCSVTPLVDWSSIGGPDYGRAPLMPYRFDPERPLVPDSSGAMVQLPTTVGFNRGDQVRKARVRRALETSVLSKLKVVGGLDKLGLLAMRWLSPETTSGREMIKLVDGWMGDGRNFLQMTFHSCTLLPGATPFVRDEGDQLRFLGWVDEVLGHLSRCDAQFETLSSAAAALEL